MRLVFDGRLKWICPRCGAENSYLLFTLLDAEAELQFEYIDETKFPHIVLRNRGRVVNVREVGERCRCPKCRQSIPVPVLKDAFLEWLEQVRQKDPKKYAEVLSSVLESNKFWR
jgi:rubredoxin